MDFLNNIVAQLPVLVPIVPLVGLLTLTLSRWAGEKAVARTLRGNLLLSCSLGVLLLLVVSTNWSADQSEPPQPLVARVPTTFGVSASTVMDSTRGNYFHFAVDGLNVVPILLVLGLSPVLGVSMLSTDGGRTAAPRLFLVWQASVLLTLLSGDFSSLGGAILLSAIAGWALMSAARTRFEPALQRRMTWQLLGTFLAVGGLMGLHATAEVLLSQQHHPWSDAGFHALFAQLERMSGDDPEQLIRFRQGTQWCGTLLIFGAMVRLGIVPMQGGSFRLLASKDAWLSVLCWIDGPVLSLVIVWRALQFVPLSGLELLSEIAPWMCGLTVWYGIAAGHSGDEENRTAFRRMQLAAIVGLGLCSTNLTAFAGCLCFVGIVPMEAMLRDRNERSFGRLATLLRHAFVAITLWGVLRGQGAGGEAPLLFLPAAIAYLYAQRPPAGQQLPHAMHHAEPVGVFATTRTYEIPRWFDDADNFASNNDRSPVRWNWPVYVLQIGVCALMVPQWIWSPVSREFSQSPLEPEKRALSESPAETVSPRVGSVTPRFESGE